MSHGPNEALRFERLRAQDGTPLVPPPAMQPLCRGGGLDPAQVGEATRQWQAAQAELQSMPSYPAEERLFWTAFLLARHYAEQGQRPQLPGLIHQTLPMMQQARHQQILLGLLARNAAAMGDLDTAAQILPQLDPGSEDLQVDTSFRFTTAYVGLLRHDHQTVLSVLGTNIDDIPISDAYDLVCGVYRAHAHEQLGNLELAHQQLQRIAASPQAIAMVEQIVTATPQAQLLPRTLPLVKRSVAQLHEHAIVTDSGIKVGRLILIPLVAAFVLVPGLELATDMLDPPLSTYAPGILITVMVLGILALTFSQLRKGPAQRKRLMHSGVEGVAQLMVVEQTGTRVNDQPMLRLRMIVTLPGQPPYSVVHNEVVAQIRLVRVQPGATMRVRVDPNDRKQMAIAWD